MNESVIKSFLVGLGFSVDKQSLKEFNDSILKASARVTALYGSIKAATAAIVYGISKISEGFEQLGYEYRIISPAINKTLMLRRELLKAYSAAGINITKVVQASVKLNYSIAKTKFALEAIYKSVGSRFFELLTKQSDNFRKQIYANMPRIQASLEKFVKFVFKAFEATVILGNRIWSILTRVYDFFYQLHKATDGWSTILLSVVAAWKLLNLAFLATPLGQVLTGLLAILALYDDFKTFQEGGKSLFDWTSFLPVIDAVKKGMEAVKNVITAIYEVIGNIILAFYQLFKLDFSGFADSMKNAFKAVLDVFAKVVEYYKALAGIAGASVSWAGKTIAGFFGDNPQNTAANIQANPTTRPLTTPIGGNVTNSQSNQNVSQQTSINIIGSADANATGRAVANEQNKVNFDLVRNMKGATR